MVTELKLKYIKIKYMKSKNTLYKDVKKSNKFRLLIVLLNYKYQNLDIN